MCNYINIIFNESSIFSSAEYRIKRERILKLKYINNMNIYELLFHHERILNNHHSKMYYLGKKTDCIQNNLSLNKSWIK